MRFFKPKIEGTKDGVVIEFPSWLSEATKVDFAYKISKDIEVKKREKVKVIMGYNYARLERW